jgi:YD repeat-containing protein
VCCGLPCGRTAAGRNQQYTWDLWGLLGQSLATLGNQQYSKEVQRLLHKHRTQELINSTLYDVDG